jgi:hypothetical protein
MKTKEKNSLRDGVGDDGEADEGYKAKDYSRKESEAT